MTTSTDRTQYRALVAEIAAKAKAKLPECNGRVEKAVALVLQGDVELLDDGTAQVFSQSNGVTTYHLVNGVCDCQDYERAPHHFCKHRLSVAIVKRVQELLPVTPEVLEPWPDNDSEEPVEGPCVPVPAPAPLPEAPHGIDPRHIVVIAGRPFVKFAGLLDLAHQRGLQSLTATWTQNTDELSLAHAVAVFPFGTFEECADATPANVNKRVAPHFRRCALTRAKARCLRDALNCDMVALEELADE